MSYKSKQNNKIVENDEDLSGISFWKLKDLIVAFKSEVNKVNKLIKVHSGFYKTEGSSDDNNSGNSPLSKISSKRKSIIRNLYILLWLGQWIKNARVSYSKLKKLRKNKEKTSITKPLMTLGRALLGVFESTGNIELKPFDVTFGDLKVMVQQMGDKSDLFINAIVDPSKPMPAEGFKLILQKLPPREDGEPEVGLVELLKTTPEKIDGVYRATRSEIQSDITDVYNDIKGVQKARKAAEDAVQDRPQDSGLSDQDAEDLALFDELFDDDGNPLEEGTNKSLTQANLDKIRPFTKNSQMPR